MLLAAVAMPRRPVDRELLRRTDWVGIASREEHEASRKPLSDKLDDAIARIGKIEGRGVGMSTIVSSSLTVLALLAMLIFGVLSQIHGH
jgi:hypothetical protein